MSPKKLPERSKILSCDLLSLAAYEAIRPDILPLLLDIKRSRRVALGTDATLVFENRDIVLFHMYERLRAEHVRCPRRRAGIVAEHEQLLPGPFEIRASLFIDGSDAERGAMLAYRMTGALSPLSLRVGAMRVRGDVLNPMPSAVHYVRFDVRSAMRRTFKRNLRFCVGLAFDAGAVQLDLPLVMSRQLVSDLLARSQPINGQHSFSKYSRANIIYLENEHD